MINPHKEFCYRIMHISNLPLLLQNGIVNKRHIKANDKYTEIGNTDIIGLRNTMPVKIEGYKMIGDYIPFYFTPRSPMLYNIVTGFRAPLVPRRKKEEILVIRFQIKKLTELQKWFFTDGQANDMTTRHYNSLAELEQIDWNCIQQSDFSKSDGDYDRPRRYQAEFLVYYEVPLDTIESLNVYNQVAADLVVESLLNNNINLAVNIMPKYFF